MIRPRIAARPPRSARPPLPAPRPVPRAFPGATFVLLGGGPSLTQADVDAVRGRAIVVAVNDAYKLAPWADVLYACDAKWWRWHGGVPSFAGPKYALDRNARFPGVAVLRNTGTRGLELDPTGLRTGRNSGYQAINLAVHLGAKRIVLLGYDMQPTPSGKTHWFGDHPDRIPSPYRLMRQEFDSIAKPLRDAGVDVVNCSRRTALEAFPTGKLEDELPRMVLGEPCEACG